MSAAEPPPSDFGHAKGPGRIEQLPAIQRGNGRERRSGAARRGRKRTGGGSGLGSDSLGARAIYSPVPKIPDELREDGL